MEYYGLGMFFAFGKGDFINLLFLQLPTKMNGKGLKRNNK